MKPVFLLLCTAVVITVSASCKKSNSGDDAAKSILGTWELSANQTSMIPTIHFAAGNGNKIRFTTSGYQSYSNGQLIKSGTYAVVADGTAEASVGLVIQPGQFTHRIVYDGDNSGNKVFFQVSGDELTTLSGYFPLDGGSNIKYARLSAGN